MDRAVTLQIICILVCAVIALTGAVAWIVEREKPLPPPKDDQRAWSINYMTDFKRWTR